MVNVPVITKRELNTYFLSPIAYVVLTGFALAHGILFAGALRQPLEPSSVAQWALYLPVFLLVPAMPLITMRLLSEETNRGTIETLMTAPVTEVEVVLGKFLGALIFAVVMMAPIAAELTWLRSLGELDSGPILSGFLGLTLLAGQFIAIGLFCSALTRIQIASAIISFVVLLGLYFLWFLGTGAGSAATDVLRYLAPPFHFLNFLKGVLDTRDLAYFAVTTAAFLFLTVKALELRKWR
jgi:ABC-2 type transport system permease protein